MKTETTPGDKMNSDVAALVRSLKVGGYGQTFWHGVYAEAERRGLIVWGTAENGATGYIVAG